MPDIPCLKIRELFWVNEHIPYVLVSGWERLNDGVKRELEVIALNRNEFVAAWGLEKDKLSEPYETIYTKVVDRKRWYFNIHAIDDGFWGPAETERILKGRVKDPDFHMYLIHPADEFWALLYHATYHLEKQDLDIQVKLSKYRPADFTEQINDRTYAHKYLTERGFYPVRCKDKSVGYIVPGDQK